MTDKTNLRFLCGLQKAACLSCQTKPPFGVSGLGALGFVYHGPAKCPSATSATWPDRLLQLCLFDCCPGFLDKGSTRGCDLLLCTGHAGLSSHLHNLKLCSKMMARNSPYNDPEHTSQNLCLTDNKSLNRVPQKMQLTKLQPKNPQHPAFL